MVAVIDDDDGVRESLCGLFKSVGLVSEAYRSIQEFLDSTMADRPGCIVCDIRLPGRSGLEFVEDLHSGSVAWSVVLISAHVDVQMAVRAMRAGAVDVLTKPVREQDLLEAVNQAISQDRQRRADAERSTAVRTKFAALTERERQVMAMVATGLQNKQIADRIGISEATVKLHRGQVMRKMGVMSVPELMRMADILGDPGKADR